MVLVSFYEAIAQICFTLLGLWWLVVQTRHATWIRSLERRRTATHISLYFLLPGGMSLLALLPSEVISLWRWSFGLASVLGMLETLHLMMGSEHTPRTILMHIFRWGAFLLYAMILVVAFSPALVRFFDVEPLIVTGVALTLIVLLGVNLAWDYFLEPPPEERRR